MQFLPAENADAEILTERVMVSMTLPHTHPGIPGVPEGTTCPRCNAERALEELLSRATR